MKIHSMSSFTVNGPLVTIVMPVYNGACYLDSAIRSILQQKYCDWELICIDDGSTDGSDAIIVRHAVTDSRIRHLSNGQNLGLPATLNRGFAEARGKLHSWTSDDNILRPNMIAKLVEKLEADPNTDIVYAGYSVIDDAENILRYIPPRPIEDRWYGNPVGAAFLYRQDVTKKLKGYDEALFGAEDYDYWMRAAHHFQMKPVDIDLYLYRRHERSLTDQRSDEIRQLVSRVLVRKLEHVDLNLLGKALASHPWTVLRASPQLTVDLVRAIWHRVQR